MNILPSKPLKVLGRLWKAEIDWNDHPSDPFERRYKYTCYQVVGVAEKRVTVVQVMGLNFDRLTNFRKHLPPVIANCLGRSQEEARKILLRQTRARVKHAEKELERAKDDLAWAETHQD